MSALHRLAGAVGLQVEWEDAAGQSQTVSDDAVRQVLGALGYPAESDSAIVGSLEECALSQADLRFLSADLGQPVPLPPGHGRPGRAEIALEGGGTIAVQTEQGRDGLFLPPVETPGYHHLRMDGSEICLAVAPLKCLSPGDIGTGSRPWGAAAQIPSLRDEHPRPFGDFGSLATTARDLAAQGADALAISPVHALFPTDPMRFSPYGPSSRLFLNIAFADPALLGSPLPPMLSPDLIEWQQAIPQRLAALRHAYDARSDTARDQVKQWHAAQGEELERHAIFDALFAHHAADGARGWQDWPAAFHDPAGEAVARFAAQHRNEVEFYIFAQWLAAASLEASQKAAVSGGMALGLISDLAVGMDGGGSHAWSRPGELLTGVSVGAPPDLLGPQGQDWGLTNFSPAALKRTGFAAFIATLRVALGHAGGVRIDHILGLNRLWVVPHGATAAGGAYLTYPLEDMLRILAIESHRARGIVIGEDLGTVPRGLRSRLKARHVLGMRVLQFERDSKGTYLPPQKWDRKAVAMTGTHDTPTAAGWWSGRDIDWNRKLGRIDAKQQSEHAAKRERDRKGLWTALSQSGAASGKQPGPEDTHAAVDAAVAQVAATPCELALIPLEDIVGLVEQPNLPGTTDEHPNWRRRMPEATADLLARPVVAQRLSRIEKARP